MKIGIGDVVKIVSGEYEGMVGTVTHIGTGGGCEVYCPTSIADLDRYIDVWDFNLEPLIQDKNEVNEVKAKFKVGDLVIAFNRHDRKYVVVSAEWTQGCPEYRYSCNWFDADGAHTEEFSEHVLTLCGTDEENPIKDSGERDDYILRSDAVFAVQKRIEQIGMGNNPLVCSIRQAVRDAPAADVEPVRHGYWYFRGGRPCCSVCNTKALWKDEGGTGGFSHEFVGAKSKWCPECGAKMNEESTNA